MTADNEHPLESFGKLVLGHPELQARLRECLRDDEFVALVVQLAAERGLPVPSLDVQEAMRARQRAWIERSLWLDQRA